MKIVLSRKGFVGGYGDMPNLILPDGTFLPFPVPQVGDPDTFSDLTWNDETYWQIIQELKPGHPLKPEDTCHLDPDLRPDVKHPDSWKFTFGHGSTALKHLIDHGATEPGTIFLFYGCFRQTEYNKGKLAFVRKAPELHVLCGYMEVETWLSVDEALEQGVECRQHANYDDDPNGVFVAREHFSLDPKFKGWGVFRFDRSLVLTREGEKQKSHWDLPECFRHVEITYNGEKHWKKDYLESSSRGPEFVVDANESIQNWALGKIRFGMKK